MILYNRWPACFSASYCHHLLVIPANHWSLSLLWTSLVLLFSKVNSIQPSDLNLDYHSKRSAPFPSPPLYLAALTQCQTRVTKNMPRCLNVRPTLEKFMRQRSLCSKFKLVFSLAHILASRSSLLILLPLFQFSREQSLSTHLNKTPDHGLCL